MEGARGRWGQKKALAHVGKGGEGVSYKQKGEKKDGSEEIHIRDPDRDGSGCI